VKNAIERRGGRAAGIEGSLTEDRARGSAWLPEGTGVWLSAMKKYAMRRIDVARRSAGCLFGKCCDIAT